MTDTATFAAALGHIFQAVGADGWLSKTNNTDTAVKVIVKVPARDDMVGDAPMSLDNRFIDLAATSGAATGDLVTVSGATYILGRSRDPDPLGLSYQWIGVPFGSTPALSFSYHASGYPLVTYTAGAWTAP